MKLKISGASKPKRDIIKKLVHWTVNNYIGERGTRNITIYLRFTSPINPKEDGQCTWHDKNYKPREFDIEISDKLKNQYLYYAIIHECIHVKQFYYGELSQDLRTNYFKWQGKLYPYFSASTKQYRNFPWEREAYKYQKILYKKLKNELRDCERREGTKKLHN